jgi:hypothetical protein
VEFFVSGQDGWIDLQQSLGIVGGLLLNCLGLIFTIREFRRSVAATLVNNRIGITSAHRELTLFRLSHQELSRINQVDRDVTKFPVSEMESDWLSLNFLHFSSCFFAIEKRQYERPDHLVEDVRSFLSLPAPKAAWNSVKNFHNARFVAFVDQCLAPGGSGMAPEQILNSI